MSYFVEINDGKTYAGQEDDFHFIYNANTGGGQSFLGGKFRDETGNLVSPATLNGRIGIFRFALSGVGKAADIVLDEADTRYEIKPRAAGENNMKLSVGTNPTPSAVVSTFLMLPETCGVKRSENTKLSALSGGNYWVHSMWMSAMVSGQDKAILTLRDCVLCGGVDKQGQGQPRYFKVDFKNRISDIISISEAAIPDVKIKECIDYFADIYKGARPFVYSDASMTIRTLMSYMSEKYPAMYSGLIDPMSILCQFVKRRSSMQGVNLQKISYGAPGTGKSHGVDEVAAKLPKEDVVRTTFHPDSDYSTFVGSYKPKMTDVEKEEVDQHLTIDQLAGILKKEYDAAGEGSDKGKALAVDLYAEKYFQYLDGKFGKVSLMELVGKAGLTKGYMVGLRDSINVAKYHALQKIGKKQISYEFVPQAFAKAYVQAWKRMTTPGADGKIAPVMLVIEEINRGDCAKIFGDLFQLLDRRVKDDQQDATKRAGFSEYPVLADSDLADFIRGALTDAEKTAITTAGYGSVVAKEHLELMLPPNMYIWATMNTSDQSLFPMDSAFKRRWDWKYTPIKDEGKNWKIQVGGAEYDWWKFLKKVNAEVLHLTSSEDKQLGYFFVKPTDDVVDAEMFVNKVMFFLWNVVFKDCYTECEYLKNGDEHYTFKDFFKDDGTIDEATVKKVLDELFKDSKTGATA